jgi:hypothetical protein
MDVPAQTGFWEAVTTTFTGRLGFTTINMELLRAGLLEMQLVSEEVSKQVITSPFKGV